MATEPKSVRETNIRADGLSGQLDLVQKMVWWVIGLLGTMIAGAIAIWIQLGEVRTSVAVTQTEVKAINDKISKLDGQFDKLNGQFDKLNGRIDKLDTALERADKSYETAEIRTRALIADFVRQAVDYSKVVNIKLSPSDYSFLSGYFQPKLTGIASFTKVGSVYVRASDLKDIPEDVFAKIPGLRGYRWAPDVDGSIVIVDAERRVVLILEA